MKKVILSWSSGKDSALTLNRLLESTEYEVVALFTTYYQDYVPFQTTPINILKAQVATLELPHIMIKLPQIFPENTIYEKIVVDSLQQTSYDFDFVAFGDMFCNGIVEYRKSYIEPAGWQCLFPLLGEKSADLALEIIARKIETFICCVDSEQLQGNFVGKEYDHEFIQSLPDKVDPCGENGEFHSFVYGAPFFQEKLSITKQEVESEGRFHRQIFRLD